MEGQYNFDSKDLKESEIKYNGEKESGKVSQTTQFNYSWHLIHSPQTTDVKKGVLLLQDLCTAGTDQRDFLYFLAEGNYKLSEYPNALKYINRVLNIEPNNKQAKDLKEKIEHKMKRVQLSLRLVNLLRGGKFDDAAFVDFSSDTTIVLAELEHLGDGVLGAAIAGAGMVVAGGTVLAVAGAAALIGILIKK